MIVDILVQCALVLTTVAVFSAHITAWSPGKSVGNECF